MVTGHVLVIGVGNTAMGDDGIGPAVVGAMQPSDPTVATLTREGDPTDLSLAWEGYENVIIIDACSTGRPPGEVTVFEADELGSRSAMSTHGLGLADAITLARHLGRMPHRLVVLGVEGATFEPGPLSTDLAAAMPTLLGRVDDAVKACRAGDPG